MENTKIRNPSAFIIMRYSWIFLLPFLLMQFAKGGERERKIKVQALIEQLSDAVIESREVAYTELCDKYVRKRDIPELNNEIARNANSEAARSLQRLIAFIRGRWRLPDGGWTADGDLCGTAYENNFNELGCFAVASLQDNYRPRPIVVLDLLDFPRDAEKRARAINLILILEPESLMLNGAWQDITFLGIHTTLEELSLEDTLVTDLTPLKVLQNLKMLDLRNAKIRDLNPLKGLSKLRRLYLGNTNVSDLTPLKAALELKALDLKKTGVTDLTPLSGLRRLSWLSLSDTKVADLTPLGSLPKLTELDLKNTEVTDLASLKEMPELSSLILENTKVTNLTSLHNLPKLSQLNLKNTKVIDLTPMEGLLWLREVNLENTKVTNLKPLKGLPSLKRLYLHNSGVTDLTPLKGMSVYIMSGKEVLRRQRMTE